MEHSRRIREKLVLLYGEERAQEVLDEVLAILGPEPTPRPATGLALSEKDSVLITYGDQVSEDGTPPLCTLHNFLKAFAAPVVNSVHILPFFPYSSDDGFSIIDYTAVNPDLGEWGHIRAMGLDFRLMVDAVINHISAQSDWFQAFLRNQTPYKDYFKVVEPGTDLSAVVRPRALPLLTEVATSNGNKHVWTTFSEDQIDLNFSNPDVLLEILKVMLHYVENGAKLIRLDAIAYLWKIAGTSSIHLPQTHTVIQLMRDVLDWIAPDVLLITETNVPHEENVSYFGDGTNEAQMVYQFPLPPLILHTMAQGDATALSGWAAALEPAGAQTTFFNFAASHDGIGLRPASGLLSAEQINALVQRTQDHGGHVSFWQSSDGGQQPYELNISYFDAVTHPEVTAQNPDIAVQRFVVSQAILLALVGVPGIYFHSLFGSRNDENGVSRTGRYRSINREKLGMEKLEAELADPTSIRAKVFRQYKLLLEIRGAERAFHPMGTQTILQIDSGVFAVERRSPDGFDRLLALHNVTDDERILDLPDSGNWHDLITDRDLRGTRVTLSPYQIAWLKAL